MPDNEQVPDSGITALVVDDDLEVCAALRMLLETAGYRVLVAHGGLEGLDLLRRHPVDLIVCDVEMPEMDGHSFREWCQVNSQTRETPFLFVTGRRSVEDRVRALDGGVDDYVLKPFEPEELLARLRAAVRRRRQIGAIARQDTLTQLVNARAFEEEVSREISRIRRYAGGGTLALLELDDFEELARRNGPAMGDLALIRFADMLRGHCRDVDVLGLLERPRFALFLPHTGDEGARILLGRIREVCAKAKMGPLRIGLGFHAGLSETPRDAVQYERLLELATEALDRAAAKGAGEIESAG